MYLSDDIGQKLARTGGGYYWAVGVGYVGVCHIASDFSPRTTNLVEVLYM